MRRLAAIHMKLVFYGDSVTDADRNKEDSEALSALGCGYVRDIAGTLTLWDPAAFEVVNLGFNGYRIIDLYQKAEDELWRMPVQPDVITVLAGVNDLWHKVNRNGVGLERFETFYRMFIEDTRSYYRDVRLILMEPFMVRGGITEQNYEKYLQIYEYDRVIRKLAEEYGCGFIPLQEEITRKTEQSGHPYTYIREDGFHPNFAGARLIADRWLRYFQENIYKNSSDRKDADGTGARKEQR